MVLSGPAPLPRVSIITATYNGARFLPRFVDALRAQSMGEWECIFVDDGSTDETLTILSGVATRDARFRIVAAAHTGSPARGRNMGIARTQAPLIAFCDQDDYWFPDKLALQLAAFAWRPDAVLCHTGRLFADAREAPSLEAGRVAVDAPEALFHEDLAARVLHDCCQITCSSVMATRDAVVRAGGFNETLVGVDDYHLWARIAAYGALVRVDAALVCCTLHEANLSTASGVIARGLERMASVLADEREPAPFVRAVRAQADKAHALVHWVGAPLTGLGFLARSFARRPRRRTAALIVLFGVTLFVPRGARARLETKMYARRRAQLLASVP